MLVEIVTAPSEPARATIRASAASFLAFRTSHATPVATQPRGQPLRLLDGERADQHRPPGRVHAPDLVDDRPFLGLAMAEDDVRVDRCESSDGEWG